MSDRAEKFSEELRDLMKWENSESEKVFAQLKSEGKKIGLDSYSEEFAHIRAERNRRLQEIRERYKDLPPDTEIKLW